MDREGKLSSVLLTAYSKGYRVTEDGILLNPKGARLKVSSFGGKQRYPTFNVYGIKTCGQPYPIQVHKLAAYCFYGESIFDDGVEIRHLDHNVLNFGKGNIVLGTHEENMRDTIESGREYSYPSGIVRRRLTLAQRREILESFDTSKMLAAKYGVSSTTIRNVRKGGSL